jgi:CheY-like chemotaxis protein
VSERGGFFGVYSELGVGTTMKVYLPRVDETVEPEARPTAREAKGAPVVGTVLVVEDDNGVRRSAVRALTKIGCTVQSAASPEEALALLRSGYRPDLVFTDVVMPGMTGPELVVRIRELIPNAKVLFTTGYTSDMAFRHKLLSDEAQVLTKPYAVDELAEKVRTLLDG